MICHCCGFSVTLAAVDQKANTSSAVSVLSGLALKIFWHSYLKFINYVNRMPLTLILLLFYKYVCIDGRSI